MRPWMESRFSAPRSGVAAVEPAVAEEEVAPPGDDGGGDPRKRFRFTSRD